MTERRPLMAANWKMNKTVAEADAFLAELLPRVADVSDVDVVVCPPFTALEAAARRCEGSEVRVAAQNVSEHSDGAYTGEVSTAMLVDVGVSAVVLGHSERREMFGETDEALARKVPAALAGGLLPILCVGETAEERDRDEMYTVVRNQINKGLEKVKPDQMGAVVIAYEPIWAIGTGRTATPDQAQEAIEFIRALVKDRNGNTSERIRILYGGSMKPGNAAELMAEEDIDGGLVGGASLDPDDFASIVEAAAER